MVSDRRAEALRNMALHGTRHEAATARAILEKLDTELTEEEPVEDYYFSWQSDHEKKLLLQIAYMVFDKEDLPIYTRKGMRKNKCIIKCTKGQHEEIGLFYSSYRRALKDELEITVVAFIQKNKIFSTSAAHGDPRELTDKDRKALKRMDSIDRVAVRKRIAAKEPV